MYEKIYGQTHHLEQYHILMGDPIEDGRRTLRNMLKIHSVHEYEYPNPKSHICTDRTTYGCVIGKYRYCR